MTDESRVLDAIDELVDSELEHTPSGWDYPVNQPTCPHCRGDAHTLPIKERMREIRALWQDTITFDERDAAKISPRAAAELEAYRYNEDDSPIVCPGTEFIGPLKPRNLFPLGLFAGRSPLDSLLDDLLAAAYNSPLLMDSPPGPPIAPYGLDIGIPSLWYSRDGMPISLAEAESRLRDRTYRFVAGTTVADRNRPTHVFQISTVWTGINLRFDRQPPLIFETQVTAPEGYQLDGDMFRYATQEQARHGHARTVVDVAATYCTDPIVTDHADITE